MSSTSLPNVGEDGGHPPLIARHAQWPFILKSRVVTAGTSKALQCFSAISCRLAMRNMTSKSSKRSRSACFGAAAALFCVVGTSTMKLESSSSTSHATSKSSLLRRSLSEREATPGNHKDTRNVRPILYALLNAEGLSAQKFTLSCHLGIAEASGRDLVVLPFQSGHYGNSLIRMEDYFDSTTKLYLPNVSWKTADPYDANSVNMSLQTDVKSNCMLVVGSQTAYKHYSLVPNDEHRLDNGQPVFLPRPISIDWFGGENGDGNVPTTLNDLVNWLNTKYAPTVDACIVGRPWQSICSAISHPEMLESSNFVKELVQKGIFNVLLKHGLSYSGGDALAADSIIAYDAVHLRRGDKCGAQWISPLRCGPAEDLPFIDMCQKSKRPLYVSTDEQDPMFLRALQDAGCYVFDDLKLDLEKEISAYYAKQGNPPWQTLHPGALAFAIEGDIVKTAQESFTLGCSSFFYETMKYRKHKSLKPVQMYHPKREMFIQVDPKTTGALDGCLEPIKM